MKGAACQNANHGSALVALWSSLTFWPWPWPKCQRSPTRVTVDHCKSLTRDASPWQHPAQYRRRDGGGGGGYFAFWMLEHRNTHQVEPHMFLLPLGVELPLIGFQWAHSWVELKRSLARSHHLAHSVKMAAQPCHCFITRISTVTVAGVGKCILRLRLTVEDLRSMPQFDPRLNDDKLDGGESKTLPHPLTANGRISVGDIRLHLASSSGRTRPWSTMLLLSSSARWKRGETPHNSAFVSGELRSMPRPTICLITAANQQVNATPGRQALVGRDQTVDLGDDRCRWKKGNKTLLQRWQRCTRRQIIVNSNLRNSASHSDRLTIMEPLKPR